VETVDKKETMMELLLALAMVLFGGSNRMTDRVLAAQMHLLPEKADHVLCRLEGRLLARFVRPGMTEEQVKQILGRDGLPWMTNLCRCSFGYRHLGLTVTLTSRHGVLQVESNGVRLHPLFD
jgi:hypothetical protein